VKIYSIGSAHIINQIEIFKKVLEKKVDAIVLLLLSPLSLNGLIDKAHKMNIPVIIFNTDAPLSKRFCFVGQDEKASGRLAGELLGKFLDGRGKIAVLKGFSES